MGNTLTLCARSHASGKSQVASTTRPTRITRSPAAVTAIFCDAQHCACSTRARQPNRLRVYPDNKKPAKWRAPVQRSRLLLRLARQRSQVDLNATVLRAAIGRGIAGNRLIRAGATGRQARAIHPLGGQIGGHALRPTLRQVHVVLAAAGAVGKADDLDAVLVELLERAGEVVQRRIEVADDFRRVGGEGDIARHDQLDLIALTLHLHPRALHALAQRRFLLVGVVTVTGATGTTNGRANQRALAAVIMVDQGASSRPRQRPEATDRKS